MKAIETEQTRPLTSPQRQVLRSLLQGATLTEAAEKADLHRNSVYLWIHQENFRFALERMEQENRLAMQAELQTLIKPALAALGKAIKSRKTSRATLTRIAQWLFAQFEKEQPTPANGAQLLCGSVRKTETRS